jgi:hypothetical protein
MTFYMCFHDDGGATFEATPNGERSVPLTMGGRAAEVLTALLALDSLAVAYALARVYVAGASAGERAVRCGPAHRL